MRAALLLACGLLAAAAGPAAAWDRAGHRLACAITLDVMSPGTRDRAFDLLDIGAPEDFLEMCTWAERLKAAQPETAAWHMMHVPRDADAIDLARDCPDPQSCVVRRIDYDLVVLKSDAPKEDKATSLKLLMHLVADLHQPLNIAFAEDGHGADIPATFLGRPTTLYDIWNADLLDADRVEAGNSHETLWLAHEVQTHVTPLEWARESFFIMRGPAAGYVGNPGGLAFDKTYVQQNRPIAMGQIEKAGVRLGLMLNDALK